MKRIKLRCIVDGTPTGDVLFTSQPIAFLQGVDPEKGFVSDQKHEILASRSPERIRISKRSWKFCGCLCDFQNEEEWNGAQGNYQSERRHHHRLGCA